MLDLEQIRKRLAADTVNDWVNRTGLPYHIIWRVRKWPHRTPRYRTLKILSDYMERFPEIKEDYSHLL